MVDSAKVTASAHSKVLITGGYLIISPHNEGIVLQTSPQFYCTIEPSHTFSIVSPQLPADA